MINKNKNYFCMMHKIEYVMPELGICVSTGNKSWCECRVVEDRYKVSEGYKVTLQPLDDNFLSAHFYQSDFISLLRDGYIIEKSSGAARIKFVRWYEKITPTVCLEHSGYIVTG